MKPHSRHLRNLKVVLAAAATLASLALAAAPAGATTPTSETFSLLRAFPGGPPTTWSSTGLFADAGTWSVDNLIIGALPSPTTFANNFFTTLSSSAGTIKMRFVFEGNQPQVQTLCWIDGGTGAYQNLTGQGTFTVQIIGGQPHIDCTANVHVD